jgi:hypothetical protein
MFFRALSFSLIAFARVALATAQQPPPRPPREMLDLLNRVQPDPGATYKIGPTNRIELRRGDGKLSFDEGNLAFFAPLDGKVTGIVFSGHGHILAAPRDPVEKQQLARFLGAPVLDRISARLTSGLLTIRIPNYSAILKLHWSRPQRTPPSPTPGKLPLRSAILPIRFASCRKYTPTLRIRILLQRSAASPQVHLILFTIRCERNLSCSGKVGKPPLASFMTFGRPMACPERHHRRRLFMP